MEKIPEQVECRAPGRRGFTLVELLLALSIGAAVTVVVGHVVTQLTRGTASIDRRSQAQTELALSMLRLRMDLRCATAITSLSSSQIVFRHPDVTGDSTEDTVTYAWSGTAGDPLTRKVNTQAAETVLQTCRAFTLAAAASPIRLQAGTRYRIRMDMYENTGSATARLLWSGPGIAKQVIPTSQLYPAFTQAGDGAPINSGAGLTGYYHDNMDFTNQKVIRTDSNVDFSWSYGSPDSSMGSNTFSVRWEGQLKPSVGGDYTLYTVSDDTVRLWLDGRLIIDNWSEHVATENSTSCMGVPAIDVHLEAGEAANRAQLDGRVGLLNRPSYGS